MFASSLSTTRTKTIIINKIISAITIFTKITTITITKTTTTITTIIITTTLLTQARTELGQAQLKLELYHTLIFCRFDRIDWLV